MKTNTRIAIIGGGIGGLTTAIALQQAGFQPIVYESTPVLHAAGAGISLSINATQILKKLGLYEAILQAGSPIQHGYITDNQLHPLLKSNFASLAEEFLVENIAIHRASLQRILLEQLQSEQVVTGKRLRQISQKSGVVQLHFEDESTAEADVVIGADGIHSAVRAAMGIQEHVRDAHQACWRGIATHPPCEKEQHTAYEAWGKGKRFGLVPIGENQMYWFAVVNTGQLPSGTMSKKKLQELFSDFHPLTQTLFESTPERQILRNDLYDFAPLQQWYQDKMVLLGDAAHATTPNMGQGACQAIEDAWVLAQCLAQYELSKALPTYQQLRRKKAVEIVEGSWKMGKVAHLENPLWSGLRNFVMRLMPAKAALQRMRKLYVLDYPFA